MCDTFGSGVYRCKGILLFNIFRSCMSRVGWHVTENLVAMYCCFENGQVVFEAVSWTPVVGCVRELMHPPDAAVQQIHDEMFASYNDVCSWMTL